MTGEQKIFKALFEQVFKLNKGKPISLDKVKAALEEQEQHFGATIIANLVIEIEKLNFFVSSLYSSFCSSLIGMYEGKQVKFF